MEEKNIKAKRMSRFSKESELNNFVGSEMEKEEASVSPVSEELGEDSLTGLKRKNPFLKPFMLIALLVIILGFVAYYVFGNKPVSTNIEGTASSAINAEGTKILSQLGKILVLPEGENPIVASVNNADILKSQQAFFANVKNGDWLIVYPDLAIIFDAKANKIMKVGPVQMSDIPANTNDADANNVEITE